MLQIIVHIWGDMYGEEYIDKLKENISKHTTVDWNLKVLRDYETGWGEFSKKWYRGEGKPSVVQGEGWMNGYHHYNLGGLPLYRKIYPWVSDDHTSEDDVCMYLDIDMIINGDLKYFTELNLDKPWVQYDYDMPDYVPTPMDRTPIFGESVSMIVDDEDDVYVEIDGDDDDEEEVVVVEEHHTKQAPSWGGLSVGEVDNDEGDEVGDDIRERLADLKYSS